MAKYSILVDVDFDAKQIQKKLKDSAKEAGGIKFPVDGAKESAKAAQDFGLRWQEAGELIRGCETAISSMVERVYNLDQALIEFQKVSDLSGAALDNYVDKLRTLGDEVARTGKPNRSEPVCCDGKAA
jgi:hypothetical protein